MSSYEDPKMDEYVQEGKRWGDIRLLTYQRQRPWASTFQHRVPRPIQVDISGRCLEIFLQVGYQFVVPLQSYPIPQH